MSSSSSTSSASASSTATSRSASHLTSNDQTHTSRTVGLAVGFGVGIPILLTIIVLIWVTVRHHRKLREEDEIHKDIDFNGDVSYWSPRDPEHSGMGAPFDSLEKLGGQMAQVNSRNTSNSGLGPNDSDANTDTGSSRHPGGINPAFNGSNPIQLDAPNGAGSAVNGNAVMNETQMQDGNSHMFAPVFIYEQGNSQEHFSKALNNVYGPSPAYPSTEKLRAPSNVSLRSQNTGSGSFMTGGPFATPPRNAAASPYSFAHYRRASGASAVFDDQSSVSGFGSSQTALGSMPGLNEGVPPRGASGESPAPLGRLRETAHPYADLAGEDSVASLQSAVELQKHTLPQSQSTATVPVISNDDRRNTRHAYHQQARDRTSTFEFES